MTFEDEELTTSKFRPPKVALGVALEGQVLEKCSAHLGIPVLRVGHAQAACERMLHTRPLVVIAGVGLSNEDVAALRVRALDTGAQLVVLGEVKGDDRLAVHLKSALRAALIGRGE